MSVDDSVGNKELSEICIRIIENPKIVQGDYIILVKMILLYSELYGVSSHISSEIR